MDLHVELLGDEIVVTRPGTDFMTAYRKWPDSPMLSSHPKLGRSPHHLPCGQRVSRRRLSGSGQQGARAGVDCVTLTPATGLPFVKCLLAPSTAWHMSKTLGGGRNGPRR